MHTIPTAPIQHHHSYYIHIHHALHLCVCGVCVCVSHHSARCLRQRVICRVHPGDKALKNSHSIRHKGAVILNTLQPPPHGITAVISCSYTLAEQVGDQTMPQSASEGQDDVPKRDREFATQTFNTVSLQIPDCRIHNGF